MTCRLIHHFGWYLSVLALALGGRAFAQQVVYVNANLTTGAGNGTSWVNAYKGRLGLLQAIAASTPGTQIWIASGEYAPGGIGSPRSASFLLKNGVEILGGFAGGETTVSQRNPAANVAVLTGDLSDNDTENDATRSENAAHVVRAVSCDATAILDGVTITGGYALNVTSFNTVDREDGAGILIEGGAPQISQCKIVANIAAVAGGGLCVDAGAPLIVNCELSANLCYDYGAGMAAIKSAAPTVQACAFISNVGSQGAGLFAGRRFIDPTGTGGSLTLTGSTFSANEGLISAANGGGVCTFECQAEIDRCTFDRNGANGGGGVFVLDGHAEIANSIFCGNRANGDLGDAVHLFSGSANLTNCTVTGHIRRSTAFSDASPFVVRGDMTVANCTIVGNGGHDSNPNFGAGVFVVGPGNLVVRNSIVWDNTNFSGGGQQAVLTMFSGTARFDSSCVQGWNGALTGVASFNADPMLADKDGLDNVLGTPDDNVRLTAASPCIDRASNLLFPAAIRRDLDANDRFVADLAAADQGVAGAAGGCAIVDAGAFEFGAAAACRADVDCSGFVDFDDFNGFIVAFEAGNDAADHDLSGFVDLDDFSGFVEDFENGC